MDGGRGSSKRIKKADWGVRGDCEERAVSENRFWCSVRVYNWEVWRHKEGELFGERTSWL